MNLIEFSPKIMCDMTGTKPVDVLLLLFLAFRHFGEDDGKGQAAIKGI